MDQRSHGTGYAAYKVGDNVTSLRGLGPGQLLQLHGGPDDRGRTTPSSRPTTPNVKLHDLLTVSLGGKGSITHVINDTGATAQGTATVPVNLVSYP